MVPHLWAICDAAWAIHVFEGLKGINGPSFVYQLTSTTFTPSVELVPHDLEDLLVQILYAWGRDWARDWSRSGRRGEVRHRECFVQPPAEVGRASYVRKLLETNILYTWRGFRATKPTAYELHYVLDNDSETWLRRLYFFPDAEGQPTLVQNARELLCKYVAWKDFGPEEKADVASGQGVTKRLVIEDVRYVSRPSTAA